MRLSWGASLVEESDTSRPHAMSESTATETFFPFNSLHILMLLAPKILLESAETANPSVVESRGKKVSVGACVACCNATLRLLTAAKGTRQPQF